MSNYDSIVEFSYKLAKQLEKEDDIFGRYKVKCKCSHTIIMTAKKDRVLCYHCGYYVYKDKKTEMKYKIKELMKDEEE